MAMQLKDRFSLSLPYKDFEAKHFYEERIGELLQKLIPESFFQKTIIEKKEFFNSFLPQLHWEEKESFITLVGLCIAKKHSKTFLLDMLSHWIHPGSEKNLDLFFSMDFSLEEIEAPLSIFEISFMFTSPEEKEAIKQNLRSVDTEIRLGISSEYQANRILEFKGLSFDRKTTMIQEKIASLIRSRSKDFGQSIFSEMQHFLVTASEDFKKERDHQHITRIISVLFFIQKLLKQKMGLLPKERHLFLKFLKTKIHSEAGQKSVLGLLVGLNFLKEHEVFEKKHLLRAIKQYIPNIQTIENSYFCDRDDKQNLETLYLEIAREDGQDFSPEEIQKLKIALPDYLKHHIEHLTHPIFMPRNEEEIMRNIGTLSRQLRFINDIPQVIIAFDEQMESELAFTVILLRLLHPSSLSIQSRLALGEKLKFQVEKVKKVGVIRRKYIKEASVFRAFLPSSLYLRHDHLLDLNRARQDLFLELSRLFGEIRDFNGGMIAKQNEAFGALKQSIETITQEEELLLEKFFYAIRPSSMAIVIEKKYLQSLFLMFVNAARREKDRVVKNQGWLFKQEIKAVHILVPIYDEEKKRLLDEAIENLDLLSSEVLSFSISLNGVLYVGYSYFSEDAQLQKRFIKTIQDCLL